MTINIFLPEKIKDCSKGYLNGDFLSHTNEGEAEISTIVIDSEVTEKKLHNSIGVINPGKKNSVLAEKQSEMLWIVLKTIPTLCVTNIWRNFDSVNTKDINIIYYTSDDIFRSILINNVKRKTNPQCSVDYFLQRITKNSKGQKKDTKNVLNLLLAIIATVHLSISSYLRNFFIWFNKQMMKILGVESIFIQQIVLRCHQIDKIYEDFKYSRNLITVRVLGVIFSDVLLGMLFFYFFYEQTLASELHLEFQVATRVLASNVQVLLDWLSGAPAGLKQNQPLAEALSYFFSYHVYLWTIYIDVASPILYILAHLFVYVGVFGLSFQIALMRDFLNLSVLHIHCFYIYAARLHMVQVSLLGSQWRGFCDRKWNPLKQRVDARSEVRSRPVIKILSAVGFTFVVFLLPTTTTFYAVFAFLRFILLTLQGIASLFMWILNSNPICIFWLHFINSSCVRGELHFEVESSLRNHNSSVTTLALKLSLRSSPFGKVLAASHSDKIFPPLPTPKLTKILCSLVYAEELL